MDLILTHTQSDFDALGATVAASKLFPGSVPVVQELLERSVREYVGVHKDALGLRHWAEVDQAAVQRVIVVDTQSPTRLGPIEALRERPEVEWIVYDHHPTYPGDLPPGAGQLASVGSATTLLVAELERRGVRVSRLEATTMALGIYSDTGNMTFPATKPADARAIAYLLEQGADLEVIGQFNQSTLTPRQSALFEALLDAAEPIELHGRRVYVGGVAWPEDVDGIASVVHKLLALWALDVVVVAVDLRGKRTQFVARSRLSEVDVLRLLAPYDPRGHAQAASAHAKRLPVEEALADLRARLPGVVPPEPTAADLMSAPVRTIAPEVTAVEAQRLLFRYGHNAFVVVEGYALAGVVTRRDLDRAIHHGLGEQPISGFMTRRLVTATPATPLSELEKLMITQDIGRLPIVHDGALLGIVTRTDVLRVMYAHREPQRQAVKHESSAIAGLLRSVWPKPWLELVEAVGRVAGDRPLYMVGGAVRDLLLGQPNLDVDLVVEGDAVALARELALHFPGSEVHVHPQFGTAKLLLEDGRQLDIAGARTEWYAHPAALPTVEFSGLKLDLARRDFSVNAMAVRLNAGAFGELIDFFASRTDLEKRTLRVLHNLSFIEDPTRLLRAVRFEAQLGFGLDPASAEFARYAMATGRFDGIGGERNKVEWRRILSQADPLPSARRVSTLDGWRLLSPHLTPDAATWAAFRRARRLFAMLDSPLAFERWLTYLAILLRPLDEAEVTGLLGRLNLTNEAQAQVHSALAAERELAAAPSWLMASPSERARRLRPYGGAALVYLAAVMPGRAARRALLDYWTRLRGVKLAVSGTDLKKLGLPPGPRYGEILQMLLDWRLDGVVSSPEEERAALARLAEEASC